MRIFYSDKDFEYVWSNCVVCIKCPNCHKELIADAENGICKCECGLNYQLHAHMEGNFEIGSDSPLTK